MNVGNKFDKSSLSEEPDALSGDYKKMYFLVQFTSFSHVFFFYER